MTGEVDPIDQEATLLFLLHLGEAAARSLNGPDVMVWTGADWLDLPGKGRCAAFRGGVYKHDPRGLVGFDVVIDGERHHIYGVVTTVGEPDPVGYPFGLLVQPQAT